MPAFIAPLIGAAARVAGPALARAGASRVVGPAISAGAKRALPMLGKVTKNPMAMGAIGFAAGQGSAAGGGRKENFNNWFPGSTDGDGVMH